MPNPIIWHSKVEFRIFLGKYLENLLKFKMANIKCKCSTHKRVISIYKVKHTKCVSVFGILLKVQVQCCLKYKCNVIASAIVNLYWNCIWFVLIVN